ncbi:protein phosphatase 4, regulatory subunit 2 [Gamsiella multidivaricata]|nr:protein phosphatase 4, regulatory subunit 2 [Gamsiella multidivaricata]
MTEQDQTTTTTAPGRATTDDNNDLIQQIALTNQISAPWEELRTVLKQRLDQVLESNELIYTAPTVSNPLTTKLAPASPSSEPYQQQAGKLASSATSIPAPTAGTPNSVATDEDASTEATQKQSEDRDQAHVPEQLTESSQEQKNQETDQKVNAEATESIASKETSTDGQDEGQAPSEGSTAQPQAESNFNDIVSTPAPSTPFPQGNADDNGSSALSEDRPKLIPISKDTLLVETPEGYHERINELLDAFTSAPFTIQRVCELLWKPSEHHSNLIKYLRAVEKVLMITSSINEFSNPAYNGPSALDEADSATEGERTATATATANGDYARAKDLDFDLITRAVDTNEEESSLNAIATDAIESIPTEQQQISSESINMQDEDSVMEVEKTVSASGIDMEVDAAAGGSTMDGIETETETEQRESQGAQVDKEDNRGMELDQA